MKKRDFRYIFYGLKIIVSAFAVLALIFGVGWLITHFHWFAIGLSIICSLGFLISFAWVIGQHKYWDEEKEEKN
jgi:accessory gene regulator protein AgrB